MKIYSPPKEVGAMPAINYSAKDWKAELAKEEAWADKIKAWAKARGKGKNKGREINLPAGDGMARYVILTPTALIHLPIGDAWHFPFIERLRSSDIERSII